MTINILEQLELEVRRAVSLQLWHVKAIKVNLANPFKLVSGNFSPIYINCRSLISIPAFTDLFAASVRVICENRGVEFDVLAGGETAGIPFAAFLAKAFGRPMIYVRKGVKSHGLESRIEGILRPNDRVLLVEDLITDAGSKLSFIDGIEISSGIVRDVLVVFDRKQGGGDVLMNRGIRLHALTDMEMAVSVASDFHLLNVDELNSISHYLRSPEAWHADRGLAYI